MKNTIKTNRLIVRPMTNDEWNQLIDRVFDANEAYIQFGYEQNDDLRDALAEPLWTLLCITLSICLLPAR